ncbi:MAG: CoA-binding protein [Candidatus Eisenbacteria bacterium]|nr:CoA-binding protein [Candidatus Eisenbacteria bacterium]
MSKSEVVTSAPRVPAADAILPKPPGGAGLEAVFRPKSIAVIGASRDRSTVGGALFHNLLKHDFQGPIYPVNPKSAVVQSVRAYPTIADVPEAVDLAVMVVPAKFVNQTLEDCGKKGVKAAVVISAGFKEVGGEGVQRERDMVQIARRYGMRVIGPNCLGVLNTEPGTSMDATFAPPYPPAGTVAFSSQSGALGLAILEYATALNIGISHFVSVGNKADVSGNDLLEFWERDPNTSMVLLYLESFGNPRRFLEIARRVGRTKPIVAVKSGRTAAGMRAASSHTGSLAGTDSAVTALCHQAGVIRTDTMEEMFDVAMVLANQPVPTGNRVGIITNAGGPAIMATDACESNGIEVVALTEETRKALQAFLPAEASVRNPVDMIASATAESFEKAVRIVANDPNVDSLIVLYVPPIVTNPLEIAQAIVRGNEEAKADRAAAGQGPKPVLSCFLGSHGVPEGLKSLQAGHIPSYTFPGSRGHRARARGEVRRVAEVARRQGARVHRRRSRRDAPADRPGARARRGRGRQLVAHAGRSRVAARRVAHHDAGDRVRAFGRRSGHVGRAARVPGRGQARERHDHAQERRRRRAARPAQLEGRA